MRQDARYRAACRIFFASEAGGIKDRFGRGLIGAISWKQRSKHSHRD